MYFWNFIKSWNVMWSVYIIQNVFELLSMFSLSLGLNSGSTTMQWKSLSIHVVNIYTSTKKSDMDLVVVGISWLSSNKWVNKYSIDSISWVNTLGISSRQ